MIPLAVSTLSRPGRARSVPDSLAGSTPKASPLVMTLAGGVWSLTPVPNPGAGSALTSVSCRSATQCIAVGDRGTAGGAFRTLALQLTGSTWSVMSTPNRGSVGSNLLDVTCTSATRCTAVGYYEVPGGYPKTLIETWSNGTWSLVTSPNQGSADNFLGSIDCADATHCIAVGAFHGGTLIQKLSGTTWTIMSTPSAGLGSILAAVDCPTSSTCFAVGVKLVAGHGLENQSTLVMKSA